MTKVLIVEDDAAIAMGLEDDLAAEGYAVEVVADGAVASHRAREGGIDVILLDVMLPGKDGFTLCREWRKAGIETPILMLTARAEQAEKVLGLELGADDYVTKPFGTHELRARIKALLRRAAPREFTSRQVFRFGDCELDFDRGELRKSGAAVELTAIEFKLLECFVESRGRILSRAQLLSAVWGETTHVSERVVDNHILYLRRKIEDDPASPIYLKNVRGLGYRFDG
jgi:DNA-binding response OmpR family regulator